MPRYKLTLEYDGSGFVGWQRQANGLGVQQVVEEAAVRLCGHPVVVAAAGRTDAGVHARGQVAHFETGRDLPPATVRDALNALMRPHPVAVVAAEAAAADFHARFSATWRAYRYRILNRRPPPVLVRGQAWWVARPLDAEAMAVAARELIGRHDFTTFRASLCQADSPVRTLDVLDVVRRGDEIHVAARARSFLHHQVRNMVGTLVLAGEGKWTAADVRRALAARDRTAGGPTAPAHGLCLVAVGYGPPPMMDAAASEAL